MMTEQLIKCHYGSIKLLSEVLDADLVAPEDKTASGYGGLYANLQWYSKFPCRTNNVVSKTQNPMIQRSRTG